MEEAQVFPDVHITVNLVHSVSLSDGGSMRTETFYCKACGEWVEIQENPFDEVEPICDMCGGRVYEAGELIDEADYRINTER